jgi:hypothetical protein
MICSENVGGCFYHGNQVLGLLRDGLTTKPEQEDFVTEDVYFWDILLLRQVHDDSERTRAIGSVSFHRVLKVIARFTGMATFYKNLSLHSLILQHI